MSPRTEDEVRRRRGKTSESRFNVYQKVIILAGGLGLFSVIGVGSSKAPILSVGVIGATALFFFLLKNRSRNEGAAEKSESKEILPPAEPKETEYEDSLPPAEEEVVADIKALFPEGEKEVGIPEKFPEREEEMAEPQAVLKEEEEDLIDRQELLPNKGVAHEELPPEGEKEVGIPQELPEGEEKTGEPQVAMTKEKVADPKEITGNEKVSHEEVLPKKERIAAFPGKPPRGQEMIAEPRMMPSREKVEGDFAGKEKIAHIEEMVFRLEAKVAEMQEVLLKFEEKMAAMQEMMARPEEKIDLQTILAHLEEKSAKTV